MVIFRVHFLFGEYSSKYVAENVSHLFRHMINLISILTHLTFFPEFWSWKDLLPNKTTHFRPRQYWINGTNNTGKYFLHGPVEIPIIVGCYMNPSLPFEIIRETGLVLITAVFDSAATATTRLIDVTTGHSILNKFYFWSSPIIIQIIKKKLKK